MSSYYVQSSVLDAHPHSPSYSRPPQLLPVTSHHPSVLCSGLLHNTGPGWTSIHCTMQASKRRESELLPPRSIGGFETDSEKFNSLPEVICGQKASEILLSTLALSPSTLPATLAIERVLPEVIYS